LPARADFVVVFSSGADTVTIDDGVVSTTGLGSGLAIGSSASFVGLTIHVGTFDILTSVGTNNASGTAGLAFESVSDTTVSNTGAGTLTIHEFTTGGAFSLPVGSGTLTNFLSSNIFTAGSGTISLVSSVIPGGTTSSVSTTGLGTKTSTTAVSLVAPYDLSNLTTLTFAADSSLTGLTATTSVIVPEPATTAMLLSALPGFAGIGFMWKRRKKHQA
jgi:hypothetical protein